MKKYKVELCQNNWEYVGYVLIKCNEVKKTASKTIVADGIEMEFDEEVGEIIEVGMDFTFYD